MREEIGSAFESRAIGVVGTSTDTSVSGADLAFLLFGGGGAAEGGVACLLENVSGLSLMTSLVSTWCFSAGVVERSVVTGSAVFASPTTLGSLGGCAWCL